MKIWVTPCSDEGAKIHLKDTVINFVNLNDNLLLENGYELINEQKFKAWGFKENYLKEYDELNIGDLICFYQNKKIIYKAKVCEKHISKKLSNKIWDCSSDKSNWPLIVFINEVEKVDIHIKDINYALGYNEKYIFQSNRLFDGEKGDKLLTLLNDYEENLILKTSVTELPSEYKGIKIKLNKNEKGNISAVKTFDINKIIQKTFLKDFRKQQEVNCKIGDKAEEIVLKYIRDTYDFDEVKWISKTNNTSPFDIVARKNTLQTFFEVKGTANSSVKHHFYMSANEFNFVHYCKAENLEYKLIRVINMLSKPNIFEVDIDFLMEGQFLSVDVYKVSMECYDFLD